MTTSAQGKAGRATADAETPGPVAARAGAVQVPPGHLFGHPTRFVETWAPAVEHVLLPPRELAPCDFTVAPSGGEVRSYWREREPRLGKLRWRLKNKLRIAQDELLGDPFDAGEDLVYDGRFLPSGNMAHILEAYGARLLHARTLLAAAGRPAKVRLVTMAGLPPWARRALELLEVDFVATNGRVKGRAVRVDCADVCGLLPEIFDRSFAGYTAATPPKVFISRRGTRTLENEDEVWGALRSLGFERFYFEKEPVELQWSIFRNASEIVAVHGAAMAAMVFNRRGLTGAPGAPRPKFVELFTPGWIPAFYRHMAAAFRIDWVGVRGQITPEMVRDLDHGQGMEVKYELAPFRISRRSLEDALAHLRMI